MPFPDFSESQVKILLQRNKWANQVTVILWWLEMKTEKLNAVPHVPGNK
jgi:hypothetical protein